MPRRNVALAPVLALVSLLLVALPARGAPSHSEPMPVDVAGAYYLSHARAANAALEHLETKLNIQRYSWHVDANRVKGHFPMYRHQARRLSVAVRALETGVSTPPAAWPESVWADTAFLAYGADQRAKYLWWAGKASSVHQYIKWYKAGMRWFPSEAVAIRNSLGLPSPGPGRY